MSLLGAQTSGVVLDLRPPSPWLSLAVSILRPPLFASPTHSAVRFCWDGSTYIDEIITVNELLFPVAESSSTHPVSPGCFCGSQRPLRSGQPSVREARPVSLPGGASGSGTAPPLSTFLLG